MIEQQKSMVPKLRFPEFEGSWELIKLGSKTTKIGSGVTPKGGASTYLDKGIPLLRSQNVKDNDLDLTDVAFISNQTHSNMCGSTVYPKDVLLNITGASIGRSCVVPEFLEVANVNQHVCIIRIGEATEPKFIQTILASPKGSKLIFESQAGGGREGLNFQNIRNFKISIPEKTEQTKIASFLTSVDTKITQLVKKKKLWQSYKKGCMQKLFSQEIRFKADDRSEFPDWEEKRLRDVVQLCKGIKSTSHLRRLIDLENIMPNHGRLTGTMKVTKPVAGTHAFEQNDVLFGRLRPYLKKVYFAEDHGFCSGEIWVLRSYGLVPRFLYQFVCTSMFQESADKSAGSKMPRADWKIVGSLGIHIPCLNEQTKIANFLTSIDRKIDLIDQELEKARTFKKGLLQQMFV